MQKQTGLSASTIKQAHALMKNSNTTDYKQQVAMALAVLAQEKKSGSSSYKADAETVKTALQTMTDNADTRGSGSANSTASVKSFDGALSSLSSVVTGHLGSDPSGGAPKTELFDPTNNPTVVNSWA